MLWSKISVIAAMQLALSYALGRALIPVFRRMKTGRFDPYIGDRFKTDGSEPAFGGLNMLCVFVFGAAVSAMLIPEETARLFGVTAFIAAVTIAGVLDDRMTDISGKPYGIKSGIKLGFIYAASLALTLCFKLADFADTEILLPFHLGYIDFGAAYSPVTAAFMTAMIYSFSVLNRFGTDENTCIGGLCAAALFAMCLSLAAIGTITDDGCLTVFGYTAAAAAMGSFIWGLSPSKQRYGMSGGLFCGTAAAAAFALCGKIMLAVPLCGLAAVIDAVCTAAQYLVYKKSRKFLLKSSSLHAHMTEKGMSDHSIIIVFLLISALGCAGGIAFAAYGKNILM